LVRTPGIVAISDGNWRQADTTRAGAGAKETAADGAEQACGY
jgi:hypothetical protein